MAITGQMKEGKKKKKKKKRIPEMHHPAKNYLNK